MKKITLNPIFSHSLKLSQKNNSIDQPLVMSSESIYHTSRVNAAKP